MHRDWSINLGKAGTAPSMYPAKFSFNPNATPSCANDFVVFPVNAVGSATLSSPYVDYGNDLACLGNDIGVLYRIKNVFCTTTACATDPVGSEYAPIGEFFNSTTGGDILFVSLLRKDVVALVNFYSFFATTGWNATVQKTATEGLGASGVVIDNSSASAQASSIYFNALNEDAACSSPQTGANTGGCAVKLTQAGLR
jgi:hypothetical protein